MINMVLTFTVESEQFPTVTITKDYNGYSLIQLKSALSKLEDAEKECYRLRKAWAFQKGIQITAQIKELKKLIKKVQSN